VHRAASWCIAHWASSQHASKRWIRSPDGTTSTSHPRTNSTVPASTRDTYGLALRGTYSIATFFAPATSAWTPASSSCQRR
jgi:hypothetical protein